MTSRPILTEPGVKYFLGETLKNCKKNKDIFNVQLFNLGLFVGVLTIVTALLVYKYKTKLLKMLTKLKLDIRSTLDQAFFVYSIHTLHKC